MVSQEGDGYRIFWTAQRITLTEYSNNGKTKIGEYYVMLLDCLKEDLGEKKDSDWDIRAFSTDNARTHSSTIAMEKLHQSRFSLM